MRNVFLGLLLFLNNYLFSQSNFLVNNFDVENISSENVNSIFLDKNNFFWISTPEGLNRYDGTLIQFINQIHLIAQPFQIIQF